MIAVGVGADPASCSAGQQIDAGSATSFVVSGLKGNADVRARVCAVDAADASRKSAGVVASAYTRIPEITNFTCGSLDQPKLKWTGSTQGYLVIRRALGVALPASCGPLTADFHNGVVGDNSMNAVGGANETYDYWVCSYDAKNPVSTTTGKKMRVAMPKVVNNQVLPGSCTPLP